VKAGHVAVSHVRDLCGVVEREKAQMGVLICMEPPTQPMLDEAAAGGIYESPWGKHPKIQIITVEALLSGASVDMPPIQHVNLTFRKAPKAKAKPNSPKDIPFNDQ